MLSVKNTKNYKSSRRKIKIITATTNKIDDLILHIIIDRVCSNLRRSSIAWDKALLDSGSGVICYNFGRVYRLVELENQEQPVSLNPRWRELRRTPALG